MPEIEAGKHDNRELGVCALELVAWMAGEEHSDQPKCVCPFIGAFVRDWNDAIFTTARRTQLLKPLLPLLIGTVANDDVVQHRSHIMVDWMAREMLPAWLDVCGDRYQAITRELRATPAVTPTCLRQASLAVGRLFNMASAVNVDNDGEELLRDAVSRRLTSTGYTFDLLFSDESSVGYLREIVGQTAIGAAVGYLWPILRTRREDSPDMRPVAICANIAQEHFAAATLKIQDTAAAMVKRMCDVGRAS